MSMAREGLGDAQEYWVHNGCLFIGEVAKLWDSEKDFVSNVSSSS